MAKKKSSTKTKKNRPVFILIPAYYEGPTIYRVITGLQKHGWNNIIVANDGTPDNTSEEVKRAKGVYLVEHLINRGKGANVRTAIAVAKMHNAGAGVTVDGDLQHDPADVQKLVDVIDDGYDVALGTRFHDYKNMPLLKRIANMIGNIVTFLLFGIWVTDSQGGLRAYSRKALELIETKADRYGFDSEVLKEIKRHKLTFKEVPVSAIYNEHSQTKAERQTFMNGIKSLIKMISTA